MIKNLTYSTLSSITEYLEAAYAEALRDDDKDKQEQLQALLEELADYGTYVANYA